MPQFIDPLDGRTHFDAGQIDTHFGTNGLTQVSVPYAGATKEGTLAPQLMAVDSAGRTIIGTFSKSGMTLRRVNAFGVEDTVFAASPAGQRITYTGRLARANRPNLDVDASNRIYVLNALGVARFTSSGKVDRTFGKNGTARLNVLKEAADMDVGADGKIYVVGSTMLRTAVGNQIRIVRLTSDGVYDTSFGALGAFTVPVPAVERTDFDGLAEGMAVKANADGSATFAGQGSFRFRNPSDDGVTHYAAVQAVRVDARGRLDKTYGNRGIATRALLTDDVIWSHPYVIGIRANGSVVFGDSYETDSPNPPYGGLDVIDFSPAGVAGSTTYAGLSTIVAGKFVGAGNGEDYFVNSQGIVKLKADGSADTAFNGGAILTSVTTAATGNNGGLVFAGTGSKSDDARINVGRFYTTEGPSGILIPTALTSVSKTFDFSVVWQDDEAVRADDLVGIELRISGANFYAHPTVTRTETDAVTGNVTAFYSLRFAPGKTWTAAANGLYVVSKYDIIYPRDTEGNSGDPRPLGTLVVNIA